MMFPFLHRLAVLFLSSTLCLAVARVAQAQATGPIPIVKQTEIARVDRRPPKVTKTQTFTGDQKKPKDFSYSYLLPFGVGQFERDKTIMGTALATAQAGFLLMYFERANAVRASNADAADVMRGADLSTAGRDPAMVAFLDQNEKFTLQAQQQQNMAILGFFALYTVGVVEAVFDPLDKLMGKGHSGNKKKRREANASSEQDRSRLVEELKNEQMQSKVGVFYQPQGTSGVVGLSLQKPF